MIVGSLFSGVGMLDYGLSLAGIKHAWFCEADPFRRDILRKRWPGRPVFDDVRTVGAHNAERVDGIVGGFPCKGASTAGKRNGFDHAETVLWREMARAIGELRPSFVVVENVANLLAVRGGAVWGEVLGDLASLGFDAVWDCFPAAAFGAPHLRDRVICVASHSARIAERAADYKADAIAAGGLARSLSRVGDPGVAPDPERNRLRKQSVTERGRAGAGVPTAAGEAAADSREGRREGFTAGDSDQPTIATVHARRLGVPVEWGIYEGAIRRWEQMVGPAPEPICAFRGVDARAAARLDKSRLSALGDGVQAQLGELAGRYLMSLEERAAA